MSPSKLSWTQVTSDDELRVGVDTAIYPLSALFRVCYLFTDRTYIFLSRDGESPAITIRFTRKNGSTDLAAIAGDFSNELINQRVRADIAAETQPIRELIVAQAFAEADLLDRSGPASDYGADPRGVTK